MLKENIATEDSPDTPQIRPTAAIRLHIPDADGLPQAEAPGYDQEAAERAYFERISEDIVLVHWRLMGALPDEVVEDAHSAFVEFETALDSVQFSTPDRERFVREGVERYREIIINALNRARKEEGVTLADSLERELEDERVPNPISYRHLTPQEHMRLTAHEMRKALALAHQHRVVYPKGAKVDAGQETRDLMALMEVMRDRILRRVDFREYRKPGGMPYELDD